MLGARIAVLRREQGMSQGKLAALLGVSPSAIGMYEQGRREPSGEMLVAMSRIFGVTTDYLLTGQPAQPTDQQVLEQVLQSRLDRVDAHLNLRRDRPFSREELAVLLAAMLSESIFP